MEAIDEAVASGARLFKACEAISLCERRYRRWLKSVEDKRGGYRAKNQALTLKETEEIVRLFSQEEYANLPVKTAHAKLMDQGIYMASVSSCERVMRAYKESRRRSVTVPPRKRPELLANGPNQVWCWDITWLPSEVTGKFYYLYMVVDLYSRYIVAWDIHTTENGKLAKNLFEEAVSEHLLKEGSLIVHSDNGKPMTNRDLRVFFGKMGIHSSYSRPHTSNDNAFAESLFSTMKGRVLYPEYFSNYEASVSFVERFVDWYNYEHFHSGLDMTTPCSVHYGFHDEIMEQRNHLLEQARKKHPARHGKQKKVFLVPKEVQLKHKTTLKMVV